MDLRASVLKLFSGSVLLAVIEFVAIAAFTRALGTGAMGSFFLFQTTVGIVSIPADLGVSRAVEKHLSADERPGEVMATAVCVKLALLLPWILGLVLAAPAVEQYIGVAGLVPLVVVGLVTKQTRGLSLRVLAGQMQVEKNALLKVIGKLVWVGVGVASVYVGSGITAVIAAFVLGDIATVCAALVRIDLTVGRPRVERARELVDFGRYVFIGSVGGFIYQWMDVAILRLFVPLPLIGAYEIAWRVASLSMLLTQAIRASLFPQISRWHAEDRLDEIESAFYRWLQLPLYVTIPAFAGAVVLGEDVLGTLFGADAVVAYPVLLVFMLEKVLRSVQMILSPSLFAMDKPQLGYRGSVAAIAVNVVLNVVLIPPFGLLGAAVATTLGAVTAAAVAITYVSWFVDIRIPWARVGWSLAASALMAGVVFLLRGFTNAGWVRVVLGVTVGVVCYFALLLANTGIRLEIRNVVEEFRGT